MSHSPPLHCHQSSTATASPWHPVPRGDSPSHSPASAYAHSCAFGNTFFWQERDATKSVHLFQAGKISQTIAFLPPHYNHWKQRNNWSFFFFLFFSFCCCHCLILSWATGKGGQKQGEKFCILFHTDEKVKAAIWYSYRELKGWDTFNSSHLIHQITWK